MGKVCIGGAGLFQAHASTTANQQREIKPPHPTHISLPNTNTSPHMTKEPWERPCTTPEQLHGRRGEIHLLTILSSFKGAVSKGTLLIPVPNGALTEIDAVMVHESGVYVFENKEYSGTLSGGLNDRLWMKASDTTITVTNPVLQNRHHCEAVAKALNIQKNNVHSVIVISDACDITKVPQDRNDFIICHTSELKSALVPRLCTKVLSTADIESLSAQLEKYTATKKTAEKHAKHIAELKKEKKADKKRNR